MEEPGATVNSVPSEPTWTRRSTGQRHSSSCLQILSGVSLGSAEGIVKNNLFFPMWERNIFFFTLKHFTCEKFIRSIVKLKNINRFIILIINNDTDINLRGMKVLPRANQSHC